MPRMFIDRDLEENAYPFDNDLLACKQTLTLGTARPVDLLSRCGLIYYIRWLEAKSISRKAFAKYRFLKNGAETWLGRGLKPR